MDASVFIASKKVFWLWILSPLVIRFAAVVAIHGLTSGYLERFDEAKACAQAVADIQPEVDANDWVLKRYEQNKALPLNERFYQLVSDRNLEYGVNLNAKVDSKRATGSKVVAYKMDVEGAVNSVYQASSYLADLLFDPLTSIQRGRIFISYSKARGTDQVKPPETTVEAGFERLSFFQETRGAE